MNVLIVGSGGREHALAWKLSRSPRAPKLYALPGSDAIAALAERLSGDPLDPAAVVKACKERAVELVVIGPEAPLAAGVADALRASGIKVFGPGTTAAQLESSKAFAKDFLKRHRIPTAAFEVYDDPARAADAAAELPLPLVVKADGLAAGKGVRVCKTRREAIAAVQDFMLGATLGEAGKRVVIEECLQGPELSVLVLLDGKTYGLLPAARDHKRLLDRDEGPNTGGMGAYAPVPDADAVLLARVDREVLRPVVAGLKADGFDYRGVLYVGLMLTPQGPKVLEFNVRFGDPETQAILPLLESDLLDIVEACAQGTLERVNLETKPGSSLCVVLASQGYPDKPATGRRITGLDSEPDPNVVVFHAGTRKTTAGWLTAGGRVLNVVATGADLPQAREKAYAAAARIAFDGMRYRKDVATTIGVAS